MWIDMSARKPTQDDADEYGCVIVWHLFQGVMITGWRNAASGIYHTHWQKTPDAPEGVKERYKEIEEKIFKTRF